MQLPEHILTIINQAQEEENDPARYTSLICVAYNKNTNETRQLLVDTSNEDVRDHGIYLAHWGLTYEAD